MRLAIYVVPFLVASIGLAVCNSVYPGCTYYLSPGDLKTSPLTQVKAAFLHSPAWRYDLLSPERQTKVEL